MTCGGCLNEAYHIHGEFIENQYMECCEKCGNVSSADAPVQDVYWPGREHTNPQLCDDMGKPYQLRSKGHKAAIMKQLGVSEVGDKVRGAPYTGQSSWAEGTREYRKKNFEKDRPELRRIYKEWREGRRP